MVALDASSLIGLQPVPVFIAAACWELCYRIVAIAIILTYEWCPWLVRKGFDKDKLLSRGGIYAIALIHATIMAVRGAGHVRAMRLAPAAVQLAFPDDAEDPWYEPAAAVELTNLLFFSWLTYDLGHMILQYPILGAGDAVMHHIGFMSTSYICATHRILPFPFAWLLVGELSSIPLNLRWFILNTGRSETPAMRTVNVAFACTFFATRIVIYGLGMIHLWTVRQELQALADTGVIARPLLLLVIVLIAAGYLLNMAWFTKILRMARGERFYRKVPKKKRQ